MDTLSCLQGMCTPIIFVFPNLFKTRKTLLERWLSQRVGYCVPLNSRDVGRLLYDGKVFYDLLHSFGIVNLEMFGGVPGRGKMSSEEAYRCLTRLCDAFRFLNIEVDDEYLRGISNRNGPYSVRLLYQLYLKLEDKQFLELLTPKKDDIYVRQIKELVMAMNKKRRRGDPMDEDGAEKEVALIKQYNDARKRIIKHCAEDVAKRRAAMEAARNACVPIDFKAGGEQSDLTKLLKLAKDTEDEEALDLDPKEYVDSLKARDRQRLNAEHLAEKLTPKPVIDVWTDILERMDDVFKADFKTKMNQQSDYEEYQAKKWVGAHHKFKRFYETGMCNYVDSDEEDDSGHIVKNEILRKGGEAIGKKQKPLWKLHEKLYKKKIRQRKRCNYEMCRHIVQDLIDVLMKVLLYRYENKRGLVPRKLMNDWKEAFFKSNLTSPPERITVVESSVEEEEMHPEDDDMLVDLLKIRDFDSEIFIDREVIKLINEFNLHCYLYLVGPWDPSTWADWECSEENLTVNGFIVHRLLESKYPLPKGYQDPQFDFKFKAALSTIKDPNTAYIYNAMRNLLSRQDMVVIDVIEPMNFCLNAYHTEMAAIEEQDDVEKSGAKPSNRRQSKRQSKSSRRSSKKGSGGERKSKAGGRKSMGAKQRKSMGAKQKKSIAGGGGRKSMTSKGRKSMTGGKGKGSRKTTTKSSQPTKHGKDKAVQCPSIDALIPRVNHSTAGLLGKDAFTALNSGRPVSDLLSGKMLVEYLKMKKDSIKGVALISYPLTVSQAVLLEFLMTGRPMKTDYKISPEIEQFIHDELRPQPYLDTRVLVNFEELFAPDLQELSSEILDILACEPTATILHQEHARKPPNRGNEDLEAIDVAIALNAIAEALPKDPSKAISGGNVSPSQNIIPVAVPPPTEDKGDKVDYPYWTLKSYNIRTPSKQELALKIQTEVYNLGRFRPYLSAEAYEKLKAHVLALMAWNRSKRKYRQKQAQNESELEELDWEETELEEANRFQNEEGTEPQVKPSANIKNDDMEKAKVEGTAIPASNIMVILEDYKRPVTYVELLKLRSSEIMPRPNKDQMEIHYSLSSFFLKFIKCLTSPLAKKEEEDYHARKLKYEKFLEDETPGEDFVLDRIVESEPDSYYKVYGKKEVFDYSSLDSESITRLCRMILGEPIDEEEPRWRASSELFDLDALHKLRADLPSRRKSKGDKGGRKSTANKRKSTSNRRASKRKSTSRKSTSGKRKSTANKRKSQSGRRQSSKNTRKITSMKGGKKKDEPAKMKTIAEQVIPEEDEEEEEEAPPPPPTPLSPQPPPPPPPKPGEEGWEYLEEPIPDIYQIYLATTWETIEFEYLSNLLNLLYLMRVHDNRVIPYRNFVREEMESALLQSDKRMETVAAFQKAFNDVTPKLRQRADIKQRLHCRIYALYNDLVDIADSKRRAALAKMDELLHQRWVSKHLFTLANLFLNVIQVEANRTIESLQLMHDYYFAMLQKPPSSTRVDLLNIPKIFMPKREESTLTVEELSAKKPLLPWEKVEEKPQVPDFVVAIISNLDSLLKNSSIKSIDPNPTYPLISRGIELTLAKVNELFDFYEELILDPELGRELRPKILKKLSAEEEKERRKQEKAFRKMLEQQKQKVDVERHLSDGRDSRPRRVRKKKKRVELEEEELVIEVPKQKFHIDARQLQMVDRLKWEWLIAVQNEVKRLKIRLDLIQRRAEADLDEVLTIMKAGFDEFDHDIGWQYRREMRAIEEVINTFKAATDLQLDTPVPMVLDGEQFYYGKYPIAQLFPEIPPPPNTPIIALPSDFTFTLQQLNNFIRKIEDVSPDGMLNQCFIDILEDMVAYNQEMNYEFLPPGWSELTRRDIKFLVEQVFGPDYVVNWRDFLLFCAGLRFPTVEEIVEMRMRFKEVDEFGFENIPYSVYMSIPLWYEKDLFTQEEIEWGQEMKKLLFKLFRTSRKEVNYTELLLTLCKGKDPEEGLGKGLSLMLGVGYIFWPDPPDWIHPRHVVDYILIQLLHDVIVKADYMTVTDLQVEQEEEKISLGDVEFMEEEEDPAEILKLLQENEGEEEEVEEEAEVIDKYKQILWRTCVPYEACLALMFVALRFWELPASHMLRQIDVESGLRKLFQEKGVGSHIKAYKLAQSDLMKNIFYNSSAFKECNVPEMVYSIVQSKHHVIGARTALENKEKIDE